MSYKKGYKANAGGVSEFLNLDDVDETAYTGEAGNVVVVNGTEDGLIFSTPSAPGAHATTHSDGGADEITVQNLGSGAATSGQILTADGTGGLSFANDVTASAHAASHSDGGSDEITVQNLGSGAATSGQILTADGAGGLTMADDVTPSTHASSHNDGGSDELTVQSLGSGAATAGTVMYADGAGAWTTLGLGTANQVLTVNSGATAPEWAAAGGGGASTLDDAYNNGSDGTSDVITVDNGYIDLQVDSIAGTNTPALRLSNNTSASTGTRLQQSPALEFFGNVYDGANNDWMYSQIWQDGNGAGGTARSWLTVAVSDPDGTPTERVYIGEYFSGKKGFTVAGDTVLYGTTYFGTETGMHAIGTTDSSTGLSTCATLRNTTNHTMLFLQTATSSQEAFAMCYDSGGASAPTTDLLLVGWTDNTNTFNTVFKVEGDGLVKGQSFAASDDITGEASHTTFTNATASGDTTAATLGNTPTGIAAGNAGWIKIYVGTTTAYVPYWTA